MYVDTIGALLEYAGELDASLFDGEVVSVDLRSGSAQRRLFHNPRKGSYAPRVTWWPGSAFKVEFSVSKMAGLAPGANVSVADTEKALDLVDLFVRSTFGITVGVREWKCQRVDYAVNIQVGEQLPLYLALIQGLRLSSWSRVPFGGEGVVWKARGRWVKFYTRRSLGAGGDRRERLRDQRAQPATLLRFEVSNYKDSVGYMAKRWFGCERTVQEMVRPGRALFVLAHFWSKLGLGAGLEYGQRESELVRLREAFGVRGMAGAGHVLMLHRAYGADAYKTLGMVSKASYYKWLSALRAHGFLIEGARNQSLVGLNLPVEAVFALADADNLKSSRPPVREGEKTKNTAEIWADLKKSFGLSDRLAVNDYLVERYSAYACSSASA